MNSRQKEVAQVSLDNEQAVLKALEDNYTRMLGDVKRAIKALQGDGSGLPQSKAYQLDYQRQLEKQIEAHIAVLQGNNFTTVAEYLNTCYTDGFIGTLYDLQGQGVPLVLPMDERAVVAAVSKTGDDIKLSQKIAGTTDELKAQVVAELQRGFTAQLSYADIARNISNYGQANLDRSMLITRTEGHRVQNAATYQAQQDAKSRGADVVKQWDSTLDGKTRPTHRALDQQVREIDDPFEMDSKTAMYPGDFGDPAEDCNCRCIMVTIARWALGAMPGQRWDNENGGLIDVTDYADFKKRYSKAIG